MNIKEKCLVDVITSHFSKVSFVPADVLRLRQPVEAAEQRQCGDERQQEAAVRRRFTGRVRALGHVPRRAQFTGSPGALGRSAGHPGAGQTGGRAGGQTPLGRVSTATAAPRKRGALSGQGNSGAGVSQRHKVLE